jgi:hypothetical protein
MSLPIQAIFKIKFDRLVLVSYIIQAGICYEQATFDDLKLPYIRNILPQLFG